MARHRVVTVRLGTWGWAAAVPTQLLWALACSLCVLLDHQTLCVVHECSAAGAGNDAGVMTLHSIVEASIGLMVQGMMQNNGPLVGDISSGTQQDASH